MSSSDAAVNDVVHAQLGAVKELDEDVFAYILGIVKDVDAHGCDPETLGETVRRGAERDPYCSTLVDKTRGERGSRTVAISRANVPLCAPLQPPILSLRCRMVLVFLLTRTARKQSARTLCCRSHCYVYWCIYCKI